MSNTPANVREPGVIYPALPADVIDRRYGDTPEAYPRNDKARYERQRLQVVRSLRAHDKRNLTLGDTALLELHRQHTHPQVYDETTLTSREQMVYLDPHRARAVRPLHGA